MSWCDCSHCIRRRAWNYAWHGIHIVWISTGVVAVSVGDWWGGIMIPITVALVVLRWRAQRKQLSEDMTCKVELAAQMLRGAGKENGFSLRTYGRHGPPQPKPTSTPTAGRKFLQ